MRFTLLVMLLISITAQAQTYLLLPLGSNVRIELTNEKCNISQLLGSRATVYRDDGKTIQGCWATSPADKRLVRINWANPTQPNDFAEFRYRDIVMLVQ